MFISEVSKLTGLTQKAIEYYALKKLIFPTVLENGYREYSDQDIERLNKISVLRKLDVSVEEIRCILNDATNEVLQALSVNKEFEYQRAVKKRMILQKLIAGQSYEEINEELQSIEQGKTIINRLSEAFPGYYGRFICMHFARFLNEPIQSEEQQSAYDTILSFLDRMPAMVVPKELEEYMIDGTKHIGAKQVTEMLEATKGSVEKPDEFLKENKEVLEQYLEYKKSEEYKNSPAFKVMALMKTFHNASGYYDIFIPAMKKLSISYAAYYHQLEIANEKLLAQYPEIETLND